MPYASKGLYVEHEAGYYKISSEAFGFAARIDGDGNFQVLMSDRHFNKTCGLCGDFNIFAEDDFRTQEGKLSVQSIRSLQPANLMPADPYSQSTESVFHNFGLPAHLQRGFLFNVHSALNC